MTKIVKPFQKITFCVRSAKIIETIKHQKQYQMKLCTYTCKTLQEGRDKIREQQNNKRVFELYLAFFPRANTLKAQYREKVIDEQLNYHKTYCNSN